MGIPKCKCQCLKQVHWCCCSLGTYLSSQCPWMSNSPVKHNSHVMINWEHNILSLPNLIFSLKITQVLKKRKKIFHPWAKSWNSYSVIRCFGILHHVKMTPIIMWKWLLLNEQQDKRKLHTKVHIHLLSHWYQTNLSWLGWTAGERGDRCSVLCPRHQVTDQLRVCTSLPEKSNKKQSRKSKERWNCPLIK